MFNRYVLNLIVLCIFGYCVHVSNATVSDEQFLQLLKLVESQNSRIIDLERTVNSQQIEIQHFRDRINHVEKFHKKEVSTFSKMLSYWKRKYYSLCETRNKTEGSSSQIRKRNIQTEVTSKMDNSRGTPIRIENRLLQNEAVGFYAYMSNDEENPGKHHTLIFDVMKTNEGNAYNKFSGLFTVPIDGLYVFSCSINMLHQYAFFNIVKNANIEAAFAVDAYHESEWRYSSVTVVLALVQGDIIFVRTSDTQTPHGSIRSKDFARTSFSGWKI